MSDEASISFDCTNCGHTIRLTSAPAGIMVPCPVCGGHITVPAEYRTEITSKLKFKEDKTLSDKVKTCPSCGKVVPSLTDICVDCGHDWRPKPKPWERSGFWLALFTLAAALILGVVALVGWAVWNKKASRQPPPPVTVPGGPDWTDPPVEAGSLSNEVPADPGVETTPEQPKGPVNRPDLDLRRSLTEQLNQSHPMHKVGDEVALRTNAGTLIRGTLVSLKAERLVMNEHGTERSLGYEELDPRERIYCDQAYRERLIDQKMNIRK